jgi:Skp family chaperone for outer membrane proteins
MKNTSQNTKTKPQALEKRLVFHENPDSTPQQATNESTQDIDLSEASAKQLFHELGKLDPEELKEAFWQILQNSEDYNMERKEYDECIKKIEEEANRLKNGGNPDDFTMPKLPKKRSGSTISLKDARERAKAARRRLNDMKNNPDFDRYTADGDITKEYSDALFAANRDDNALRAARGNKEKRKKSRLG